MRKEVTGMSEDTTATIDGSKVFEDLAAGLPEVAGNLTFPHLLDALHGRGLCLDITDHYGLVQAVAANKQALEAEGLTFRQHRQNGATKLTCGRRDAPDR